MKTALPILWLCLVVVAGAFAEEPAWKWPVKTPADVTHVGDANAPAASPLTYPDAAGFRQRADMILDSLGGEDLTKWRRGYFSGGDPGKYLPGAAMAKLLRDPQAADARKLMNDDRSYKEHYHFAAVNWARFLPLFGSALTPETQQRLAKSASTYGYFGQGGTENHKTMWLTTANVLPWYVQGGRLSNLDRDTALRRAKDELRKYVKGLYLAGQGEWDSPTYVLFDINGLLNIYDFSQDDETRLLARAGLDYLVAAYALKYTNGLYAGPNQRGFYDKPVASIADHTGWLWWNAPGISPATLANGVGRYSLAAITSTWRPSAVLCRIARREVPTLPFSVVTAHPNYWYGQGIPPKPGQTHDILHVAQSFTLGTLLDGYGGQMTRFMIAVPTSTGTIAFTAGSPIGKNDGNGALQYDKLGDGGGMFDQWAATGTTALCLTRFPAPDIAAKLSGYDAARFDANRFAFFTVPANLEPKQAGPWWTFHAGQTLVAVRPVIGNAELTTTPLDKSGKSQRYLKTPGNRTGLIVEVFDLTTTTADKAIAALNRTALDTARWDQDMAVTYINAAGRKIEMKYQDGPAAAITIDNQPVTRSDHPIIASPYVHLDQQVLTVNDGRAGYVIDFTGDLPIYKAWTAGK